MSLWKSNMLLNYNNTQCMMSTIVNTNCFSVSSSSTHFSTTLTDYTLLQQVSNFLSLAAA